MKITNKPIIAGLTLWALTASLLAQTPLDQFQAAVASYQKTASSENALQVIKLFKQLESSPAVPEEAREPFVMGGRVLKKASNPAEASQSVELFTQSLKVAPWFAEAYYNRALARETAGQFNEAMDDLKLYLEFKLADTERREAQDKIYSLKADAQLAVAKKAEATAKQEKMDRDKAQETAKFAWILGAWTHETPGLNAAPRTERVQLVKSGNTIADSNGKLSLRGTIQANGDIAWEQNNETVGRWLSVRVDFPADRRSATIWWPVPDIKTGVVSYYQVATSKLKR